MSRRRRSEVVDDLMRAWRAARLQTDLLDDAAFQKLGINRTDGRCLDVLSAGPMTATAIALACGVSSNAMTTVVDRLEERGLVERTKDPGDRRRVVIQLTPLASHLSTQLYGPVVDWSRRMFDDYSSDQLELITEFLNRGRDFQAKHIEAIRSLDLSWTPADPPH